MGHNNDNLYSSATIAPIMTKRVSCPDGLYMCCLDITL
jgi:hypothetical protein